jgi:LPXTG-motif cell wall-anchored protein
VLFHRIVGLLVATAAAVIMAPAAANAVPYPAEPPASSVSDGTVSDGDTVIFSGEGFLPGERISIELSDGSSFTIKADANGEFSVPVDLTHVGTARLMATGLTSGVTVTENVQVLDSMDSDVSGGGGDNDGDGGTSAGNNGALPTTGPSGTPLLIAVGGGAGAVVLGAAFLWFARSRRRDTTG